MNIDINKNYKFVVTDRWPIAGGEIPAGSEIFIVHGCVYMNGGLLTPTFQNELLRAINAEKKNGFKHIREEKIIYNEF